MKRRLLRAIALLATLSLVTILLLMNDSSHPFRVAVLPCWKDHGHQHEYDTALREMGASFTVLSETAADMDALFSHLDEYDLLLAPPLFHFARKDEVWTRPYSMERYADRLRAWLERGGMLLVTDANYAENLTWLSCLSPSLAIRATPPCWQGPATRESSASLLSFPLRADAGATFAHLEPEVEGPDGWTALVRCAHGAPTLLVHEMGEGLVVLDNQRNESIATFLENLRVRQALRRRGLAATLDGPSCFETTDDACRASLSLVNLRDKPFEGTLTFTINPIAQDDGGDEPAPASAEDGAPVLQTAEVRLAPGETLPLSFATDDPPKGPVLAALTLTVGSRSDIIASRRLRFARPGEVGSLAVTPSVFAVRDDYLLSALTVEKCIMGVRVGTHEKWDECEGVRRSDKLIHFVRIPQAWLHEAGSYTILLRPVYRRNPYYVSYGALEEHSFTFRAPVEKPAYNIAFVADAHDAVREPVAAAGRFGKDLDLLVLGGDIADNAHAERHFATIQRIAGLLTGGAVPCVYARGNHETCGRLAERFPDFAPTDHGRTYYEFSIGPIAGLVLDGGGVEGRETWNTPGEAADCRAFRRKQDAWLSRTLETGSWRDAPVRLLVCHIPFLDDRNGPEAARYRSWTERLRAGRFHLALTGHLHVSFLEDPRDPRSAAPCLHANVSKRNEGGPLHFEAGTAVLSPDHATIVFADSDGHERTVYDGPVPLSK